ncbi:MAG: hypothetical protein CML42_08225 [Rhodobacteraceae bacterium]|nr:hypothetical protein [Paracoccaceae bacterium]|tara:strand:+ start:58752 stop:59396 length:645 start_codon:yes stop_codon:yes gene_type:complete
MIANQVGLGIFFLYFVLMSGQCSEIMNCGLQRYINENNWIKHVMIFLSIYIFTFILNWYTFDSLVVENFTSFTDVIDKRPYLEKSFYYTIIIYFIFILSTKNEGLFLAIFLFGSIALVFGTIFTKAINSNIYKDIQSKYFISNNDIKKIKEKYESKEKEVEQISLYQNIMSGSFPVLFCLLLVGSYRYYLRQYKDHKHHWSWYVFWMGSNKCNL